LDVSQISSSARAVIDSVETAIVGKSDTIELALAVLLSNGHLLIEDIPGVGKTTLAKALARSLGMTFKRIQFTPDLLPSDITGSSIYNQKTGEFEIRPGPVFANIVLADEINRTTPKTQAALLECMEERQVTIDGIPRPLPSPFFVIATQNNIEMSGTFTLPEAQLDRFAARISIGYPDRDAEMRILSRQRKSIPVDDIVPVIDPLALASVQDAIKQIHVKDFIMGYILDIVTETRNSSIVQLGASPRGSLSLLHACQARAALQDRDAVIPDDVKALAGPVLAHRIIVRPEHRIRGLTSAACLQNIIEHIAVPTGPK
jgi:MoxR-like ATPase